VRVDLHEALQFVGEHPDCGDLAVDDGEQVDAQTDDGASGGSDLSDRASPRTAVPGGVAERDGDLPRLVDAMVLM